MRVLYTDPNDELALERELLGVELATAQSDPGAIEVLVVHQTIVDASLLEQYPRLKGIVRLGVGYDKVDLNACRAQGISVAHIPDYCTNEVADTAMALILTLVRGTRELEAALREHPEIWQDLSLARIRRASSLVLGVVGAGRIGSAVLERARPFGFELIFQDPAVAVCSGAQRVDTLIELLERADIVSLHLPLNGSTRGLVNAEFLARMRPGSLLVNTARGGLLASDQALLDALTQGHLAGAALDVLPVEPPTDQPLFKAWRENHPGLAGRLILNPHNAFYSRQATESVRRLAAGEAARLLQGHSFSHCVS
jgi:phosphoglycerate dehydrogenase-like enzyme